MAKVDKSYFCFDINGTKVEFVQVPVHRYDYSFRPKPDPLGDPKERYRWEAKVDGLVVGFVRHPYGFGKQSLEAEKVFGGYSATFGYSMLTRHQDDHKIYDLQNMAARFVDWRNARNEFDRAITMEEYEAGERSYEEKKKRDEEEAEVRLEQWRIERQQAEAANEARRSETLEGLVSIRDRMRSELTNFEMEMLMRAISVYTKGE